MRLLPFHSAFKKPQTRLAFFAVLLFRAIFFTAFVFVLDSLLKTGSSPLFLSSGCVLGILAASKLAFSKLRSPGFWLIIVLCWLGLYAAENAWTYVQILPEESLFSAYSTFLHLELFLISFSIAALATWHFWRYSQALTVEVLFFTAIIVYLLSAHRDYHFDTPLIINTLSWELGLEQLKLLIWIGLVAVSSLLIYLYCATLPERPLAAPGQVQTRVYRSPNSAASTLLVTTCAVLLFYLIGREVYLFHNKAALTRIANGVGQETQEGLSPLGFHSALGTTNQPAALVRLEGDYKENPFSPMLYMRETALSQFNGKELVIGPHHFDNDVSGLAPGTEYAREEDQSLSERKPLIQSIYLLTDHKNTFTIDYPISLKQLKNPNVKRFRLGYQALSLVPTFKLDELSTANVGDPAWSQQKLDLYLQQHPDPRYKEFALKIAGHLLSSPDKVRAITTWLSKNATYTLTPNHNINAEDDPVAPFLFGDLRGYCVHFAHAMVYLFRALEIPARIGTGYLTDLSQSKDGHILLRMSDRHAWAEVYLQGKGWVPFDVQPEHVESHAETQVDSKLLEELMQMLEPGELILPKDILKDEQGEDRFVGVHLPLPSIKQVLQAIFALAGILITLKLLLLYAWLFPASPATKLRRFYRAFLAHLLDLGHVRKEGETREEFSRRIETETGLRFSALSSSLNLLNYSENGAARMHLEEIKKNKDEALHSLKDLKILKHVIAFLSPKALLRYLSRGGW